MEREHGQEGGDARSRFPVLAEAVDGYGYANCRLAVMAMDAWIAIPLATGMIRKLSSGEYRLYSRKPDPKTGKRRNLGTFATREQAEKHEREVQYFKRH